MQETRSDPNLQNPNLYRRPNLHLRALIILLAIVQTNVVTQKLQYPVTRKADVVDVYHGTSVPDPYRWMEDLNSPELAAWIAEQNRVTETFLADLEIRPHLQRRIMRLWNFRKTNLPIVEAGRLFYRMNTGLQPQSPIYMREGIDAPPRS